MTITNTDYFYDVPTSTPAWILPCVDVYDPLENSFPHLSSTINSLVDSIDVLEHNKSIVFLTSETVFFNSCNRRLDQSTLLYKSVLIHARNLKSLVFHYEISLNHCTGSTSEVYVLSYCEGLLIVIDTGASSSITPKGSDFVGQLYKADSLSLKQVNGTIPVCGQCKVS